jgi:hypothetical protein
VLERTGRLPPIATGISGIINFTDTKTYTYSYWAIRLYLSGILPVISFRKMLVIYILLVAFISVPTYFIHGWPAAERWYEVLYPLIGVAVALGFYSLVAYLGKRRLEQMAAQ